MQQTIRNALHSALFIMVLLATSATPLRAQDVTPAEAKAVAEEGFVYGLPSVMIYQIMYDYAVDRNSGQFKAPFNQIKNESQVFTYKDTAIVTPNSDTPYSILPPGNGTWQQPKIEKAL